MKTIKAVLKVKNKRRRMATTTSSQDNHTRSIVIVIIEKKEITVYSIKFISWTNLAVVATMHELENSKKQLWFSQLVLIFSPWWCLSVGTQPGSIPSRLSCIKLMITGKIINANNNSKKREKES